MGKINWNKSVEANKKIENPKNEKALDSRVSQLENEIKDLKKIISKLVIK